MKWLLSLTLFGGAALSALTLYDKYEFFKNEGYWHQDLQEDMGFYFMPLYLSLEELSY